MRSQWILVCFPRQLVLWDTRQCWGWRYGLEVLGACRSTCSKWNHWRLTLFCEILMRLDTAKMSFESNPSSSSSSCPFDALFSGVVSVHSMLPELHNLKLEVSLLTSRHLPANASAVRWELAAPLQFLSVPPSSTNLENDPQFWKNVIPSEKRSLWPPKKWKWEPQKKVLFRNN